MARCNDVIFKLNQLKVSARALKNERQKSSIEKNIFFQNIFERELHISDRHLILSKLRCSFLSKSNY